MASDPLHDALQAAGHTLVPPHVLRAVAARDVDLRAWLVCRRAGHATDGRLLAMTPGGLFVRGECARCGIGVVITPRGA